PRELHRRAPQDQTRQTRLHRLSAQRLRPARRRAVLGARAPRRAGGDADRVGRAGPAGPRTAPLPNQEPVPPPGAQTRPLARYRPPRRVALQGERPSGAHLATALVTAVPTSGPAARLDSPRRREDHEGLVGRTSWASCLRGFYSRP